MEDIDKAFFFVAMGIMTASADLVYKGFAFFGAALCCTGMLWLWKLYNDRGL